MVRGEENDLLTSLDEVMIMRDRAETRPTFILARGAYDAPTEPVDARHAVGGGRFADGAAGERASGSRRWLVAPGHPLTARVIVNRYWAQLFGRGLVTTPADFGNQGRLPTHPELLDWLATTFIESRWDLKAFQKRLVMSATYRQSSAADAKAIERDPENVWLSRGPSHRLAAEQIRDAALATSGLLVRTVGGPSVYPYQPAGLWEALATRNATTYEQGHGEDLYRRSLYTVWKRSSPPPSAINFDAAERLFCTVSRQRTSTPLQSLVLMNDPQYVEAARVLAARIVNEGGTTPAERITSTFRTLTSRKPAPEELSVLEGLYREQLATFQDIVLPPPGCWPSANRRGPRRVDAAETAALAVVASTVMNFDEALVKR